MKTACTRPLLAGVLACLVLIAACADYEFRVNEKVVYTPLPLLTDYEIHDEKLAACIAQTIEDNKITRVDEMIALRCTHAGIVSLEGLETFTRLQVLQLQHNDIGSVQILRRLIDLQQLDLADNRLRSASGLETLRDLHQLDLRDNPELDCGSLQALSNRAKLVFNQPERCP